MLKRWLMAAILIAIQGCAGATLNPFVEKPYYASPPDQMTRADRELFDRALFRQTNNRIQPAIKVWGQFLEKYPRSFEAHNNLGLVYFEDDQLDASITELEMALSLEPGEAKIKKNLIRALKFKAVLYREANDYNRAVDTLKRVQEISSPEGKENVGYRIEKYENKAFEQARRVNTLEAYEGFLMRYPGSSRNSDEARAKVEGLKLRAAVIPDDKVSKDEGNKENRVEVTSKVNDLADKQMAPTVFKSLLGEDSGKETLEKAEMADETSPVADIMDNGFIPVQPLEVPRSVEQKIEIATQPEPKPATGVNPFSNPEPEVKSLAPVIASPTQDDSPEIAQALPRKKVKIVTRKDPLRVRADPTPGSRVLATVAKGSLVPLVREENGWYKIEFSTGEMGWISKKYAQLME